MTEQSSSRTLKVATYYETGNRHECALVPWFKKERRLINCMTSVFVDGIVKTMKSKAGPSSKELVTVADAEKFLANNEHSIVGL